MLIFRLKAVPRQTFLQCTLYKIPQMACTGQVATKLVYTNVVYIFFNSLHYENHMSIEREKEISFRNVVL